jgi:hypothetical protein
MTGFKIIRWFFSLLRTPVKEPAYDELVLEVYRLRGLVDSLCARTNELQETGTTEWRAQMTLMGKSHMHGHRLIRRETARMEISELDAKRKELVQDFPHMPYDTSSEL